MDDSVKAVYFVKMAGAFINKVPVPKMNKYVVIVDKLSPVPLVVEDNGGLLGALYEQYR